MQQVLGNGSGPLSIEVCNEVICRKETRRNKEAAAESRKKTKLQELNSSAKLIYEKMRNKKFKLTGKDQRPGVCLGEIQA